MVAAQSLADNLTNDLDNRKTVIYKQNNIKKIVSSFIFNGKSRFVFSQKIKENRVLLSQVSTFFCPDGFPKYLCQNLSWLFHWCFGLR